MYVALLQVFFQEDFNNVMFYNRPMLHLSNCKLANFT